MFSSHRKADAELLEKIERALWLVEGQVDGCLAVLAALLSRLDLAEREAVADAAIQLISAGSPAWMSDSGRAVYKETRMKVITNLTLDTTD